MVSLTFGLFTQVSGSGPLGPLVYSKRWEKLFSHFFNKKYWQILDIKVWKFNETLTNNIVSFEQPGPGLKRVNNHSVYLMQSYENLFRLTWEILLVYGNDLLISKMLDLKYLFYCSTPNRQASEKFLQRGLERSRQNLSALGAKTFYSGSTPQQNNYNGSGGWLSR